MSAGDGASAGDPALDPADEAERRRQLGSMKRTATGLLVGCGAVLLAAGLLEARWSWGADLRTLFRSLTLKGREEVGGAEALLVEATTAGGATVRLYFDARTGLLVRRDQTYYEDFREVDGLRLPFRVRDDLSVITFSEVKHNLTLDDARFVEEKNCFTQ